MYTGCNYGNVNVSKATGGYWKEEEEIREYVTLYSPLSDYREWENVLSPLLTNVTIKLIHNLFSEHIQSENEDHIYSTIL